MKAEVFSGIRVEWAKITGEEERRNGIVRQRQYTMSWKVFG